MNNNLAIVIVVVVVIIGFFSSKSDYQYCLKHNGKDCPKIKCLEFATPEKRARCLEELK